MLVRIGVGGGLDKKVQTVVIAGVILVLFQDKSDPRHPLQISDLAVGIRCCSKLHRGVLRLMDFRSAGERDGMSTNLKLACCDRFGSAGSAFCGRSKGTSIL